MNKKYISGILIILLLNNFIAGCGSKKDSGESKKKDITIACDYGVAPLVDDLVKDFNLNNKANIKVEYMSSVDGMDKLKSKEADVVMAFEGAKGEKVKTETIATDGIAIIVNKQNNLTALSMDQLKDIYTGKVTQWKDINGNLEKIDFVAYESTSELEKQFEKKVLSSSVKETMSSDVVIAREVNSARDRVATNTNSIGFIPGICINSDINTLKLNGVVLNVDSLKSNLYPLKINISMYYSEKTDSINKFTQYIKSDDGKKIIKKHCADAS